MLKEVTRGGQTFLHAYRMIKQIATVLLLWFIFIFLVINVGWLAYRTSAYDYYVLGKIIQANALIAFSHIYSSLGQSDLALTAQRMVYQTVQGQDRTVVASQLLGDPGIGNFLHLFKDIFYEGVLLGFIVASVCVSAIGVFLKKRGEKLDTEVFLRGAQTIEVEQLKKQLIESGQASDTTVAEIPLPKGSETQHILITGTPGSGKTVCMSELLDQIRKKNQRAIVYDHMGVYTQRFYRPDKDIVLNTLDKRCPAWTLWAECKTSAHYDAIAESLIPMPTKGQDPVLDHGGPHYAGGGGQAVEAKRGNEHPPLIALFVDGGFKPDPGIDRQHRSRGAGF